MKENIKSQKLQQLAKTAGNLFLKHGIKRISVEEICQAAGVSKMTFYKYFNDKIDLAKYVINQMVIEGMSQYRDIMRQKIPFSEKVKKMIIMKIDQTEGLSREWLGEFSYTSIPEIASLLQKIKQENLQLVLNDLIAAQKEGDVRQDIKPEFILYFFNHMFEMMDDEQLLKLYESPQEALVELTNFFFYGILPRD
jgi:AcrR family transcriptional regulator